MTKDVVDIAKLLKAGFHLGLLMDHYLAQPCASSGRLGRLEVAPALLKHEMDNPPEPTPPGDLGTAIHAAVLEPDMFDADYIMAGRCTSVIKSGARQGEQCTSNGKMLTEEDGWRCGTHCKGLTERPGRIALSRSDWLCCMGIRDNCLSKKAQYFQRRAWVYLNAKDAEREVTGRWDDADTGEPCKLRADHLSDHASVECDLKSTQDASEDSFTKSIYTFGYYRQRGWYATGLAALQRPMKHHVLIAAEKNPPYLVAVYRMREEAITHGAKQAQRLLRIYHECMASGVWPGYPDKTIDIGLPVWGTRQLQAAEVHERAQL